MTADERKVFEAVAKAQARTGLPIFTHNAYLGTRPGRHADVRATRRCGSSMCSRRPAPTAHVAIGHVCCLDDPKAEMAIALAKRGAYVGFDRVTMQLVPDAQKVTTILALVEAGHADQGCSSRPTSRRRAALKKNGGGAGAGRHRLRADARAGGCGRSGAARTSSRRTPSAFSRSSRSERRRVCGAGGSSGGLGDRPRAASSVEHGVHHLLRVAEQHAGVVLVEQRVVDAGVAASPCRASCTIAGLRLPHLEHRHAVDRARRIVLSAPGFTMSLAPITIATSVSGKSSLISSISSTMSYGTLRLGEQHVHVAGQAAGDRVDREAHVDAAARAAAW